MPVRSQRNRKMYVRCYFLLSKSGHLGNQGKGRVDGSLYVLYVDGNMKDYYYNFAGVMTLHLTLVL